MPRLNEELGPITSLLASLSDIVLAESVFNPEPTKRVCIFVVFDHDFIRILFVHGTVCATSPENLAVQMQFLNHRM